MRGIGKNALAGTIGLALLFLPGAPGALAHDRHGGMMHSDLPPVQGMLTDMSPGSVTIQTQTGSVMVPVINATHVVRVVSGSLADLHPNQHVEIHFMSGTRAVDSIQIDGSKWYRDIHIHVDDASAPEAAPWSSRRTPGGALARRPGPKTMHPDTPPPSYVGGQVVTIGKHTITLAAGGKQTTYTLVSTPTVTKILNGTTGDLFFGETVRITRDHSGNASCIVILSA